MSSKNLAIIDYAMGNIRSVKQAITHIAPHINICITHDKKQIEEADYIIFPGQGAMKACMTALKKHNLIDVIQENANKKPFLGICLGLQLLFDNSEEDNGTNGLGIFSGNVHKFNSSILKIPHMGWNNVKQTDHPIWHNIKDNSRFYSVHSYFVKPNNDDNIVGTSHYSDNFTVAIAKKKLWAVQFHPEKSQHDGLQLLKNFIQLQGD